MRSPVLRKLRFLALALAPALAVGAAVSAALEAIPSADPPAFAAALDSCAARIRTVPGHWKVLADDLASAEIAVRFDRDRVPAELADLPLRLWRYDSAAASWQALETRIDGGTATVRIDGPAELVLGAAIAGPPCAPANLRRTDVRR